jgi:hypothetical protein
VTVRMLVSQKASRLQLEVADLTVQLPDSHLCRQISHVNLVVKGQIARVLTSQQTNYVQLGLRDLINRFLNSQISQQPALVKSTVRVPVPHIWWHIIRVDSAIGDHALGGTASPR